MEDIEISDSNYEYQVGGSLNLEASSYITRKADRQLYKYLKAGEFCYVLSSRQVGKSSLRVKTRHRLQQEGFVCASLDLNNIGSNNLTPQQWYKGIAADLWRGFNLTKKINFTEYWLSQGNLPPVQALSRFIEDVLLSNVVATKIFIFIDEIDSVLNLDFPSDDFFALIRSFYDRRPDNRVYEKLHFALFGVATPSNLIRSIDRTPFNIGKAIEMTGFNFEEAFSLTQGLYGKIENPEEVVKSILTWTGGQPFLTQKLCQLVLSNSSTTVGARKTVGAISLCEIAPTTSEFVSIESLVRNNIIEQWETHDELEHLKTIRDRLVGNEKRAIALLGIYQQILYSSLPVIFNGSPEQMELLLSGLVVKRWGHLEVYNPIYRAIFNSTWLETQLTKLRIYADPFDKWLKSQRLEQLYLLRGETLKEAQSWAIDKTLNNDDYQYLSASQKLDRQEYERSIEKERLKVTEAKLAQAKKNARIQKLWLIAVTSCLALCTGLGLLARIESRQARLREVKEIAEHANVLFISQRKILALIEAIDAKNKLQKLGTNAPSSVWKIADEALQKAVYGATEFNCFFGHKGKVFDVSYSPDGETIASASSDNTVRIWRKDGTLLHTLIGHQGNVLAVAYNPDGQTLASASSDDTIKIWRKDGTLLHTLIDHRNNVLAIAYSPDGKTLASASADNTIDLWNDRGQLITTLKGHRDWVTSLAYSPDGEILASASKDRTIDFWNKQGELIATLKGHQNEIEAVAFSPDGQTLASGGDDKTIKLWSREGKLLKTFQPLSSDILTVTFSFDGQTIAAGTEDRKIVFFDRNGTLLYELKRHDGQIAKVKFSPDGQILASASFDKTIKFWKLNNHLFTTLRGHSDATTAVAYNPNSLNIASAGADHTIKLWWRNGQLLTTLLGHQENVTSLAYSPDGEMIASGSLDCTIKLWQKNGKLLLTLKNSQFPVTSVAFSPDGQTLISGSADDTVKIWRRKDGKLLKTLYGHSDEVNSVAVSIPPNPPYQGGLQSSQLPLNKADLGEQKPSQLFHIKGDLGEQKPSQVPLIKGRHGRGRDDRTLSAVDLGGSIPIIASASADNTIKLWQTNGKLITTLSSHQATVNSVAFSPDGQILASGSVDNTVKLWNRNGKLLATLEGSDLEIKSVTFSPDGTMLAAVDLSGKTRIWQSDRNDWRKVKLLHTLYGHSEGVTSVAFSPDSNTIASASLDRTIIIWNLQQISTLDFQQYACNWIEDFLKTSPKVPINRRHICDKI